MRLRRIRKRAAAMVVTMIAVLAVIAALPLTATPASAAPPPWSYIHNSVNSAVGIGVVYEMDDGGAVYDEILPRDRRTDRHLGWAQAEGYYIGNLYCANSYYQQNGVEYRYHYRQQGLLSTPRVPFTMDTDGVARWRVFTYRC
ncbi:hypothetical protein [Streptomyces cavernae]|uniref:hypothetical protein n=1 Tax=Streptomyces cavernae TaxID=2259034 RepID=UPI000FEB6420|nr:hypothetical protein [Streptomyces cavernae]